MTWPHPRPVARAFKRAVPVCLVGVDRTCASSRGRSASFYFICLGPNCTINRSSLIDWADRLILRIGRRSASSGSIWKEQLNDPTDALSCLRRVTARRVTGEPENAFARSRLNSVNRISPGRRPRRSGWPGSATTPATPTGAFLAAIPLPSRALAKCFFRDSLNLSRCADSMSRFFRPKAGQTAARVRSL
jgi:hypothetical protein